MQRKKYKLLVIDDQWSAREQLYEKVFGGEESPFAVEFVKHQSDLEHATRDKTASGYVIDLFLDDNGWAIEPAVVIEKYIEQNRRLPIFLVSAQWGKDVLVQRKMDSLLKSSQLIKGFFAWGTFEDGLKDEVKSGRRGAIASLHADFLMRLDSWHRQTPIVKAEGQPFRILHISDTQFGDPSTDAKAHNVEETMRYKLHSEHMLPDLIVLSGDIAYSGRPSEYRMASEWIKRFLRKFWPNEGEQAYARLLLVPGNHDVDLGISSLHEFGYRFGWEADGDEPMPFERVKSDVDERGHRDMAFEAFLKFAEEFDQDPQWRQSELHLCRVSDRFSHLGLQFILANTAGLIDARNPSRAGVRGKAIKPLTDFAVKDTSKEEPYRILVSHHSMKEWCPKEWEDADWERFQGLLSNSRANLWLCGHEHGFKKQEYDEFNEHAGLLVVLAPCLTLNANVRAKDRRRGFVVIELTPGPDGSFGLPSVVPFEFDGTRVERYRARTNA